jgi:beta-glucanase (GH16 family)
MPSGTSICVSGTQYATVEDDEFSQDSALNTMWSTKLPWVARTNSSGTDDTFYTDLSQTAFGYNPISFGKGALNVTAEPVPAADAGNALLTVGGATRHWLSGALAGPAQTYGYVEVSAEEPNLQGFRSSPLWLWGTSGKQPFAAPGIQELDAAQLVGNVYAKSSIQQTMLYGYASPLSGRQTNTIVSPDPSTSFHTYGVLWTAGSPGTVTFYIDRQAVTPPYPAQSEGPMIPAINLEVFAATAGWAKPPAALTPQTMSLQYFRWYQPTSSSCSPSAIVPMPVASPTPTPAPTPPAQDICVNGTQYQTTEDDEFSQDTSLGSMWQQNLPWGRTNNPGTDDAYYAAPSQMLFGGYNPVSFANSALNITAEPVPAAYASVSALTAGGATRHWLSGALSGPAQVYGYAEVSAEEPNLQGFWPAPLWLWGTSGKQPFTPPAFQELDLNELFGTAYPASTVQQTMLYGYESTVDGLPVRTIVNPDPSTAFHTYGVLWTPSTVTFYIDRVPTTPTYAAVSSYPMIPIINLQVFAASAGWAQPPANQTPQTMHLAYFRWYQTTQASCSPSAITTAAPATATPAPAARAVTTAAPAVGPFITITDGPATNYNNVPLTNTSDPNWDWREFGSGSSITGLETKAGRGLISNATTIYGTQHAFAKYPSSFAFTDGAPTASVTSESSGVYWEGLVGQGGYFTNPADTHTRKVVVYTGVGCGSAKLTASLSDSAARAVVDTNVDDPTSTSTSTNAYRSYTVSFRDNAITLLRGTRSSSG